ncbi:hypothetical protein C8R44DRAFT_748248 [Mycena epipterygia]|nr:hypothetical protein C8R44DRAFT_748248 [Mycena epipterygia]
MAGMKVSFIVRNRYLPGSLGDRSLCIGSFGFGQASGLQVIKQNHRTPGSFKHSLDADKVAVPNTSDVFEEFPITQKLATKLASDLGLTHNGFRQLSEDEVSAAEDTVTAFMRSQAEKDECHLAAVFIRETVDGTNLYDFHTKQMLQLRVGSANATECPDTGKVAHCFMLLYHLTLSSFPKTRTQALAWVICAEYNSVLALQGGPTELCTLCAHTLIVDFSGFITPFLKSAEPLYIGPYSSTQCGCTASIDDMYLPWAHCGAFDRHCPSVFCVNVAGAKPPLTAAASIRDLIGLVCASSIALLLLGRKLNFIADHKLHCFPTAYKDSATTPKENLKEASNI